MDVQLAPSLTMWKKIKKEKKRKEKEKEKEKEIPQSLTDEQKGMRNPFDCNFNPVFSMILICLSLISPILIPFSMIAIPFSLISAILETDTTLPMSDESHGLQTK
ncbi:hypothetical protein LguiB_001949 [Lonicera macranthoides]